MILDRRKQILYFENELWFCLSALSTKLCLHVAVPPISAFEEWEIFQNNLFVFQHCVQVRMLYKKDNDEMLTQSKGNEIGS